MQFFDTNVLVYRQDPTEPVKQACAMVLIEDAMEQGLFTLSTQVLQEFYNTMIWRRFMPANAALALCEVWVDHPVIGASAEMVIRAFGLHQRHQFSVWDALIVQAALDAGCTTLYSEDLQHGMRFGSLTIINPFSGTPAVHEPAAPFRVTRSRATQSGPDRSSGSARDSVA